MRKASSLRVAEIRTGQPAAAPDGIAATRRHSRRRVARLPLRPLIPRVAMTGVQPQTNCHRLADDIIDPRYL